MARTRSKLLDPVITPAKLFHQEFYGVWQPINVVANENWIYQDSQTMTDQKTPGFFRAAREGKIIPVSPMVSVKTSWSRDIVDTGWITVGQNGSPKWRCRVEGNFLSSPVPKLATAPWPTVDGNAALQEALSRAQSDAWDALTWAAEFRKTVEQFTSLRGRFERLATTFVTKVEHINDVDTFVNLGGGVRTMSRLWLELRYAWRPMLYDMADMQEALRRLMQGVEDPLQRAYATREAETVRSGTTKRGSFQMASASVGIAGFNTFCTLTSTRSTVAHAAVGVQATTRDIIMSDPFVTGWELVPFSFIVDWFFSVGDMLTAFSPFATGTLRYATLGITELQVDRYVTQVIPGLGYSVLEGSSGPVSATYTEETYQRTIPSGITPLVEVRVNLDAFKIMDLVALWIGFDRRITIRLNRAFNRLTRKFGKYLESRDHAQR